MRIVNLVALMYAISFLAFLHTTPEPLVAIPMPLIVVDVAEPPEPEPIYVVIPLIRISAYNPVPRQTWGDHTISSCGPNIENQIAVSRDLFFDENGRKHLCGTVVTVITDRGEEFGNYIIWDTMNPRYTQTADIMLPHADEAQAFAFGITTGQLIIHDN